MLLGHLMWYRAAYSEALAWLEEARSGFEQSGDRRAQGEVSGRIGLVRLFQGDYAPAQRCFEQQARIATELGDKHGLSEAWGQVGNVHKERGEYAAALECFAQSLALATETGHRRDHLFAVGNIGDIYFVTGEYRRALANFGMALSTALEIGDRRSALVLGINIGEVYRAQGGYAEALACARYALEIALEMNERAMMEVAAANMAWTYLGQGRHDEAARLFPRAIGLARALKIPYYLVDALYGQAELWRARGDQAAAQAADDEALGLAVEIESTDIEFKARLLAVDVRVALGQTNRATARGEYEALLARWTEASEQAAIYYALWRLSDANEERQQATILYRDLYARTPNVEYRRRLEELSGEPVGAPPELPPLPEIIIQETVPLEALLGELDAAMDAGGGGDTRD
jgi:tetratricopeptide (TPR) repeat protein